MNEELLQKLFSAIKDNNIDMFSEIVETRRGVLSLRFGRFPILSVCYLFASTDIIAKYERDLINIVNYTEVEELNEIYFEFKKYAKKSMRFYIEEGSIVSPLEMLAIINNAYTLRNVYAKYPKNEKITQRLNDIYRISHKQNIKQEDNIIYIKKQKLPKKQAITIVAIILLAVIISGMFGGVYVYIDGYYGKGTIDSPIVLRNELQLKTALNKGELYYMLASDMVITEEYNIDFDGTLDANNHTITLDYNFSNSFIGTLKGTLSNLNINISDQNYNLEDDFAFLINKNEGSILNVNINVNAVFNEAVEKEDLYGAIMCIDNSGVINDCIINANISYEGDGIGNAYLSGFAAKNNGTINRCLLSEDSIFDTDTVDVGGIAAENGEKGKVNNCKNYATIEQDTTSTTWNPNCAGIAMTNNGLISDCFNEGKIIASSKADSENCSIYLGGIVAINNGKISKSKNTGELLVNSNTCQVYLGGISAVNYTASSMIESSGQESILSIDSPSDRVYMFIGGIVGWSAGTVKDCFFIGEMKTDNESVFLCSIVGVATNISFSNNITLKRENIPYSVIYISFNSLVVYNEGSIILETMEEIKLNEVYWG